MEVSVGHWNSWIQDGIEYETETFEDKETGRQGETVTRRTERMNPKDWKQDKFQVPCFVLFDQNDLLSYLLIGGLQGYKIGT